jgi:hypothetical protein
MDRNVTLGQRTATNSRLRSGAIAETELDGQRGHLFLNKVLLTWLPYFGRPMILHVLRNLSEGSHMKLIMRSGQVKYRFIKCGVIAALV